MLTIKNKKITQNFGFYQRLAPLVDNQSIINPMTMQELNKNEKN